MRLTDLVAVLCGEPWHLRPWEVGKLTPYQVANVYFHEKNENGTVKVKVAPGKTYEERFRETWTRRGLPAWRVEQLWREHLAKAEAAAGKRSGK